MEQLIAYIRQFVELTDEEISLIAQKTVIRNYPKGHFIVVNGEISHYENFVISGCLRTFTLDSRGQEHIVRFAFNNWWAGDLESFIYQIPAKYNVQCIENSVIARISYSHLEELYEQVPKMERFFRIVIQRAFAACQDRITDNLSLSAKERYQLFRHQYPLLEQKVPQYMVASYLGISKEFLSKIRGEIVCENI